MDERTAQAAATIYYHLIMVTPLGTTVDELSRAAGISVEETVVVLQTMAKTGYRVYLCWPGDCTFLDIWTISFVIPFDRKSQ